MLAVPKSELAGSDVPKGEAKGAPLKSKAGPSKLSPSKLSPGRGIAAPGHTLPVSSRRIYGSAVVSSAAAKPSSSMAPWEQEEKVPAPVSHRYCGLLEDPSMIEDEEEELETEREQRRHRHHHHHHPEQENGVGHHVPELEHHIMTRASLKAQDLLYHPFVTDPLLARQLAAPPKLLVPKRSAVGHLKSAPFKMDEDGDKIFGLNLPKPKVSSSSLPVKKATKSAKNSKSSGARPKFAKSMPKKPSEDVFARQG